MPTLKPRQIFDERYRLIEYIGAGGYSEVWLAEDSKAGNMQVALKVFAPEKGLDSKGLEVFSKEYSLVFNLRNEHLLIPKHFDDYNGSPYLVMPYCKNGSALSRAGEMDEKQLAVFMQQAASALKYLHEQSPPIIHQDIKPDNFLIDDKGNYLLADFGISSRIRRTLTKSMGKATDSSGTIPYMAPERFGKYPNPTCQSDIWSLGASFYELVTGNLPLGDHGGLIQKNGADIPDLPEHFSAEINTIINACMAPQPEQRPTAEQLLETAGIYLKTNMWPAIAIIEIKPEPTPEPPQPEKEKPKGRDTVDLPADKIPTPDNYIKNDTGGGNIKPPFADSDIDNIPPAKRRKIRSRKPWLKWLFILAGPATIAVIITFVELIRPSVEEKAAIEKALQDSIASTVAIADSIAQLEKEKLAADSMAALLNVYKTKPGTETPPTNTTEKSAAIVGSFTDPRDGKTYKTVKIGNQVWMAENLNYATSSGSWCYDNISINCSKYGRLYTWEAAKKACPPGWHLPSKREFETLLNKTESEGTNIYNSLIKGGSSGFSALLVGWRTVNENFKAIGDYSSWWSSSEFDADDAWNLQVCISGQIAGIYRDDKEMGFSVRCIKD